MADVIPFPSIRPNPAVVGEVASLPYDVFNREEARAEIARHPLSFLRIDAADATLPDEVDNHDDVVYATARTLLAEAIADGTYVEEAEPHYYLYRLTTAEGHSQTGIVGCASIDDYTNGVIKKHENTRADKENDRIRHVDICNAQTGPIFLAYRSDGTIERVSEGVIAQTPLYDFTADDGVRHTVWRVDEQEAEDAIRAALEATPALYIADGHHRAASAVKVGLDRRQAAVASGDNAPVLDSDHFLSVVFPSDQLAILDYNRVVTDLNGRTQTEFLEQVAECFEISDAQDGVYEPESKGRFGMFLERSWYGLVIKEQYLSDDPVAGLDVALLQDNLLGPILGIDDPRTDKRIDFVGGIRGLGELERRVADGMAVAFALYPTSIDELFAVADAGLLMPPKSTWFEPKLRSGIFIHRL